MNDELSGLEDKVTQVITLCDALRAENRQLHDRVDALEEEKRTLAERMTAARTRLEGLVDKLPPESA
jgi:uncharacterized protein (TIGR02449 family)